MSERKPGIMSADEARAIVERQQREWEEGPEGKEYLRRKKEEHKTEQETLNKMIRDLETRNSVPTVKEMIDFIYSREKLAVTGVDHDIKKILGLFEKFGFVTNANMKQNFDKEDPENYGMYIIGQSMDMMQRNVTGIPSILMVYIEEWKSKFDN